MRLHAIYTAYNFYAVNHINIDSISFILIAS